MKSVAGGENSVTVVAREAPARDYSECSSRSQGISRADWEQLSADLVEVGQRKHGLRSRQVLGQTAVSHFGETPQLLDYAKGVFAASPGPRARPVDHPPALAQGPLGGRTPVDPVAHPPSLEKLSIVFLPVRLIAEQLPLLPVQQIRQLGDVGYAGSGSNRSRIIILLMTRYYWMEWNI